MVGNRARIGEVRPLLAMRGCAVAPGVRLRTLAEVSGEPRHVVAERFVGEGCEIPRLLTQTRRADSRRSTAPSSVR
ncbi:hypothetical protein [Streptomyces phaeolivaceus]|uniref:hypothetical protein n=1 Tax=Streptomyces phaeolivaceus TaxID=2653200 RepID=UPI00186A9254|nr:hypothetical protein [Streptomyces phaeolivaceus]